MIFRWMSFMHCITLLKYSPSVKNGLLVERSRPSAGSTLRWIDAMDFWVKTQIPGLNRSLFRCVRVIDSQSGIERAFGRMWRMTNSFCVLHLPSNMFLEMRRQMTHLVEEVKETFTRRERRPWTRKFFFCFFSQKACPWLLCMFPAVRSLRASIFFFSSSHRLFLFSSARRLTHTCGHTHRCNHPVCSAAKAKCPESARSLSNLQTYGEQFLSGIAHARACVCVCVSSSCVFACVCVSILSLCTLDSDLCHSIC